MRRRFNPRPRTRGDSASLPSRWSTHSFNPRPRTRGDQQTPTATAKPTKFQSTPPHEGRPTEGGGVDGAAWVSIHAPARGATQDCVVPTRLLGFQSTPPHEGRLDCRSATDVPMMFQSTPPHEGRLRGSLCPGRGQPFQSTPPHEGRQDGRTQECKCNVSIHAPARGATD